MFSVIVNHRILDPAKNNGAGDRIRTDDSNVGNVALYH